MDDGGARDEIGEPSPLVDLRVGPGEPGNAQFGELLERLRWKAGLSRADAADKLGLTSEYLRLLEVGKRVPALGQMRRFLSVYGANGAVEQISPQGYRQDLIVFDPLHGEDGEPTIVEFTSRIREARRRALGGPPDEEDRDDDSAGRAAEVGAIVFLLTRADDGTLRKIRQLLEARVS
ncbi:helix-turn-helix transcriptional regulator [Geodermatophilus sp. SYSU D00742]